MIYIESMVNDFSNDEKFYEYIQIISNNSLFSHSYIKQICENVLNIKFSKSQLFHSDNPINMTFDKFIENVIDRVKSLPILFSQIDNFIVNKKFLPSVLTKLKDEKRYQLVKEKTNIIDFKKISQLEYINKMRLEEEYTIISEVDKDEDGNLFKRYIKKPTIEYAEDEAIYYLISFERKNLNIYSYLQIGYDYPKKYITL